MSRFTDTIRHPSTPAAILAYMAASDGRVTTPRMSRYIPLMHFMTAQSARWALCRLCQEGQIVRLSRGVYAWKG